MFSAMVVVAWIISIGAVCYLSLSPQIAFPVDFTYADKAYHGIAYAWLSFLPFFGVRRIKISLVCALLMIPLGIGLEFGQGFVPGRFVSAGDGAVNVLGVVLGILFGTTFKTLLSKKTPRVSISADHPGEPHKRDTP
jgi:hypothetical protein